MTGPLRRALHAALTRATREGRLPAVELPEDAVPVTIPDGQFGDFASSLPMQLAKTMKRPPRAIAEAVLACLDRGAAGIAGAEVAGAGFINLRMDPSFWHGLAASLGDGGALRYRAIGSGRRAQVEFVSANPTGPLHIGHARNAAVGDVVANLLTAVGYAVEREYYLNDHGTQMDTLGLSTLARYRESLGRPTPLPENGYRGEYIREIAAKARDLWGERDLDVPAEAVLPAYRDLAGETILEGIREDLARFGVRFDVWFRESTLHQGGAVDGVIGEGRRLGVMYDRDGAVWFASTSYGDDKDRVVVRSTGEKTYFAADIAYLQDKFRRGFDWVIDVWGKDHHGYVPRMKAAMKAFGHPEGAFDVILVTLVNLLRGGQAASMSTRSGEFLTLREIMDEVGIDASRYFLLRRRSDSPLDFDLELAVAQSQENPVYYVQYAHARIQSVLAKAAEGGIPSPASAPDLSPLLQPEEFTLIRHLGFFPEVVEEAAARLEPHRLTFYLEELAGHFHPYYNRHRIVVEEAAVTSARLYLISLVDTVLLEGLRLLGVTAPDRM